MPQSDPYVGRTIADRYEVGELISIGGMGRVHRGMQRSLERAVAIKFIHPHLLTSPGAVSRFMTEARAASRLNHPNVVSVFDFGRTAPNEGGDLYIVMELLAGSDLGKVIVREGTLPVERAALIIRQVLTALGEAHYVGITHRDVKPENIVLERFRGDSDHVKVIDFGIANIAGSRRITEAGMVMGTPVYMSPEQARGGNVGPSADIYAVAVILFELLTGVVPFDDASAHKILQMHLLAERPDPRVIAPDREVPDALAEACMRAMSIDPAERFADALAFAEAIAAAVPVFMPGRAGTSSLTGLAARKPSDKPRGRIAFAETEPETECLPGREQEVSWARAILDDPGDRRGLVFWGRPGIGRTTLMNHIATIARSRGITVIDCAVAPPPRCEPGYAGLRTMIAGLTDLAPRDPLLVTGRASDHPGTARGLRAIFGLEPEPTGGDAESARVAASEALRWSIDVAIEQAGGRVVLTIDDVDRMDGASLEAITQLLKRGGPPGFFALMTSEVSPDAAFGARLPARHVLGVSSAAARDIAAKLGGVRGLSRTDEDIEPMYVEQLRHWSRESRDDSPPISLGDILDARIQSLSAAERRVLQAVAVLGAASVGQLAATIAVPDDVTALVSALVRSGFVVDRDGEITVAHMLIRRAILRMMPAGTIALLHTRAAELLTENKAPVEIRAYHAIRGSADFVAFLLCEQSARMRAARGDHDGAIRALSAAIRGARIQLARGDSETAASAYAVFGRQLSAALLEVGRVDEAYGVLLEALELTTPRDASHALVLEQLAIVARKRGQHAEAQRSWRESLRIAETTGDPILLQRLRRPIPDASIGPARQVVFQRSS